MNYQSSTPFSVGYTDASTVDSVAGKFSPISWLGRVSRLFKAWRDMETIAHLDERTLRDIGLCQADVIAAANASFVSDPTALLAERAGARRRK